ncbi:hypothetical protein KFL_006080065 [Klebsormidium nitens]|uniref:Uncharacterized protein n=1 Tax=Klebsormidium nitens TaxID=105231 RepID=A0A1Y1ILZ5_KLENI|nr:hypothetical protein KFL_006080065 [Klebsormidium nitens]|eukprot:GAQ90171.1 hypothetical protein KFL_006080065 [Klebsormidium nitens]
MPSWAKVKAKAKSLIQSKKRSTNDAEFDWSDEGHSPREELEPSATVVPLSLAQNLYRGQAGPYPNLFAAPAGATADPEAPQTNPGHPPQGKAVLTLLAEQAGGAGIAPAEQWGRAGLDVTHRRRVNHGDQERGAHGQGVVAQGTHDRLLAQQSGSGEEQAVGVLEQVGEREGSCALPSPATPQGVDQMGKLTVPTGTDTEFHSDRAAARGADTQQTGSCHINTVAVEPPQCDLKQESKLKGKAHELPDNPSGEDSPHIPMSKYDQILAAVALPAARHSGGAPWWHLPATNIILVAERVVVARTYACRRDTGRRCI